MGFGGDSLADDQANRLSCYQAQAPTACVTETPTATYAYDGAGKRISKTTGGTTTSYA